MQTPQAGTNKKLFNQVIYHVINYLVDLQFQIYRSFKKKRKKKLTNARCKIYLFMQKTCDRTIFFQELMEIQVLVSIMQEFRSLTCLFIASVRRDHAA